MTRTRTKEESPLRLGVSSCLLGKEVRFDGGHKHQPFLTGLLGEFVEWVPVCPEVEAGMETPRPALRLVRHEDGIRMLEIASKKDHTKRMQKYSETRVHELGKLDLSGYVLKKDSPSCGLFRVKIYQEKGMPAREGRGLFASALLEAYPDLPVEDEGRLNDPGLRENFIERVFAYRRLRDLFSGRWKNGGVVAFHTRHKLQLMAHSPPAYQELGRLVAELKQMPRPIFRERYAKRFMESLGQRASRGRNVNVLQHAAGYFSRQLDADSRSEVADVIHDYQKGLVPLIVPVTLIRHHVRCFDIDYLKGQFFLEPHPKELMLRNHV